MISAAEIHLEGVVQGVGFRPFIHRLCRELSLTGFILNTSSGVEIHVEAAKEDILSFYENLEKELPPLAKITKKDITFVKPNGYSCFAIKESLKTRKQSALISPDIATCPDCLKELFDPHDRRFLYPFINCTNCGPRFSIIEDLPYDRPLTTMAGFKMCPACKTEYKDIDQRRFHAQPNACPVCGPNLELIQLRGSRTKSLAKGGKALLETVRLLKSGRIIAIKGIGGFHISCDADNPEAVHLLRERKKRPYKPFAIMVKDIPGLTGLCEVSDLEKKILCSPESPIVLLRKKLENKTTRQLSPYNNYLGVMLAYAPLHHLLLSGGILPGKALNKLVMTSANISDEPIEIENTLAINNLGGICDYFLVHNRRIHNRTDDSIIQIMDNKPVILRRSRGYSPFPFFTDSRMKNILACGAELKNTFCLAKDNFAFLSQFIGDLKTYPSFTFYQEAINRLCGLLGIKPEIIACDLHPDYLSTKYASQYKEKKPKVEIIPVQHHHSHLASVICEHRIKGKIIGVCLDGIGYGADGKIWGGEFFTGDLQGFQRKGHLEYTPMPGGDKATREPFRMGISYLYKTFGPDLSEINIPFTAKYRKDLDRIINSAQINPLLTSSCGRLFDGVSALAGICDIITFEAEAAIRLQMLAEGSRSDKSYDFIIRDNNGLFIIKPQTAIRQLVEDIKKGTDKKDIARKFHNGLAKAAAQACGIMRGKSNIETVVLSGGVFQNKLFLETCLGYLRQDKFTVYYNQLLPANDGAVSLGQAALANTKATQVEAKVKV